jgi:adenylate cyclase
MSSLATFFMPNNSLSVDYLLCCTKIIAAHDGSITSFDGDRVMGIFIGDTKNSNAATSALKIRYAVKDIIKPKVEAYFASLSKTSWEIDHSVGVDTSNILAVRAGQRGSNDLIWVGRSPNLAAKLSEIRDVTYKSYISEEVYRVLHESAKKGGKDNKDMWTKCSYNWIGECWTIYKSSWWWEF